MRPRLPAAFGCAIAVVITGMLLVPRASHALHSGGLSCYACHALNAATVEPGTTSMSTTAMTELKTHGWVSGMRLGCTFCHRSVNAPAIPDVLSSFPSAAPPGGSRHPVSRDYVDNVYDNAAYLSTDNSVTADHLDCRDCHDTTLTSYPDHDNTTWLNDSGPAGRTKSTNPYGLRNVTAPKAYDNLCRDCHDAGKTTFPSGKAIGKSIAMVTHDNGTVANPIRDFDNLNLRTQVHAATSRQCAVCHDAHLSSNLHLFSDGHERDWNNNADNAINELTDCASVCHYRGDAADNYESHGHGKPMAWDCTVLNRACTFCHDATQPHRPGDSSYFVRYRFTEYTASWNDNSVYQKPQRGVCATCHDQDTHSTVRGEVGCIDCHDQHAKGSDNNVMMIRSRNRVAGSVLGVTGVGAAVGTEAVLFSKSPKYPAGDNVFHFYTNVVYGGAGTDNAAAGFCDQRACHGARSKGGVLFTPLATFLTSGQHSGTNNLPANADCEACHSHADPGGSFRATTSCTLCHGQPPPAGDNNYPTYNEAISPHQKHAGVGYARACQKCHVYYTDGNYHDTLATLGYRTYQSVFFDNTVRRGASAYDNANLRCSNITCHSDGRGNNPNDCAVWFNPSQPSVRQTLDCTGCHNHDLSAPVGRRMASGAHTRHLASGYTCSSCHVATVADNNFIIVGYGIHTDNARNVGIRSNYDNDANPNNNWNGGTTTCSGITCHGGNPVNWVTDIGRVTCANCHVRTGDVDDFGTGTQASMTGNSITSGIDNAEWMWSGHGATPASHPGGQYDISLNPVANLLSGGGTGTNRCSFCHDPAVGHDNAANPFRLANYGVFTQDWNGNCYVCHAASAVGDSSPGYAPATDNSGTYVAKTAASKVGNNHFNPGSTLNARHSTTYNGGRFCWDCHDPHGDRVSGSGNIFMTRRRVAMRTTTPDNVGIPAGGNATTYRPSVTFTSNVGGGSYASTDNVAPYDGICEACHESASGILHYVNAGRRDSTHYNSRCLDCHTHDSGFKGAGGNNIEQFFDKPYRLSAANNYDDFSRHPLRTDNVLAYPSQVDCLTCHGVASTDHRNNECLTCHWENRTSGTPSHPDNAFQWAIPATPGSQYGAAQPATDGFCLQCHGAPGADNALNGVTPLNVIPAGEASWTAGSGHGQTALHLAADNLSGPPAYNCRACHYSTGAQTGGSTRDNYPPGFHAAMNRHLVRSDNLASREYPDTADTAYTADQRSSRMDSWCATQCHRNAGNGIPADDNVVDHTWDVIGLGQSRASQPGATHPSNFLLTVGARYRHPANLLPYSDYVSGAMPGTGNAVCITCHNPHGGGDIRDSNDVAVTPIGMKNMLRLSPADNVSTLCKACHQ